MTIDTTRQTTPLSPSQQRGVIDSGATGEKVGGFDPAAAPMETDAEAGGSATTTVADDQSRPPAKNYNATSSGTAMRKGPDVRTAPRLAPWKIAVLSLVGALIVGLVAASLM